MAVILAGGSGERFWPMSTPENPKQFLKLLGDRSLLRNTYDRLLHGLPPEKIYVVSHERFSSKIREELPELPESNLISEPIQRNTGPACVHATLKLVDERIIVVPSDHFIDPIESFWGDVERGLEILKTRPRAIVTFGVDPTRIETGYGYLETGAEVSPGIFRVERFVEKPPYETAKEFVESGGYLWNGGIFMWSGREFIETVERLREDLLKPFLDFEDISKVYEHLPDVSIDRAILEKYDEIFSVKASFKWSDIGNWASLKELGFLGGENHVALESGNLLVITSKPTLILGLMGVVIVETENGLLVASEEKLDLIRDGVRMISRDI